MTSNNPDPDDKATIYRKIYMLSTVGVQLVVSIVLGLAAGVWLDGYFGTKPLLMLLFIFLGIAAGFINVYRMAVKETFEEEENNEK